MSNGPYPHSFLADLVGKSVLEVKTLVKSLDRRFRITRVNGDPCIITHDYDPTRLNVWTKDGVVLKAYIG